MPKATTGGVSNQIVDLDYIAPPGVAPEVALDEGIPDAGLPEDEKERERFLAEERTDRPDPEGQNTGISDAEKQEGGDPPSSQETTSSPDSRKREQTTKTTSDDDSTPSNAQSAAGRSPSKKGSTTASSGDTK